MVVLHSGPTVHQCWALGATSYLAGPACPGFTQGWPSTTHPACSSGNSASHGIRPIFSVPGIRAWKSKESMGVWMSTSRKKRSVHRRWGESLSCDFQCLYWRCCEDVPLEKHPQGCLSEVEAAIFHTTQLNLSTAGFQPQHSHWDPGGLFCHTNLVSMDHSWEQS